MSIRNQTWGQIFRRIVIVWGVIAASCSGVIAQSLKGPRDSGDVSLLVILAPSGPVFLELQISVGGESYRRWTGRYLSRVMDGDGNRRLSREELSLIPRRILTLAKSANSQDVIREISGGAEVAEISSEEFIQWFNARLPKMFDLIAQPKPADDAVRLAGLLDENADAAVSDEELFNAARALRFRDLDNDETFTISELVPYRDPRSRNVAVTPDVVSLPFFHITDEDSLNVVTGRLLERYGREGKLEWRSLRASEEKTASNSRTKQISAM
jgi:Ca2+-binding EF-hand superfamily protein